MKKNYVFTYGSLSNKDVLSKLINQKPLLIEAELNNYYKVADETPWLLIQPKKDSTIKGYVFKVSKNQLIHLDWWESLPLYERKKMKVIVNRSSQEIRAFVYNKEPQGAWKEIDQSEKFLINEKEMILQIPKYQDYLFDLVFFSKINYDYQLIKSRNETADEKIFLDYYNKRSYFKFQFCQKWEFKNFSFYCLFKFINKNQAIILATSMHNFLSKKETREFIKNFSNLSFSIDNHEENIKAISFLLKPTFLIYSNKRWKINQNYLLIHRGDFHKEWRKRVDDQIKFILKIIKYFK